MIAAVTDSVRGSVGTVATVVLGVAALLAAVLSGRYPAADSTVARSRTA
jgi:hypothetical protein